MTDFVGYIIVKLMKITTQGDYGLKCILRILEGKGNAVSIEEICRSEKLSIDYVEQLLIRLRRQGLVNSVRGPGGGYVLGKNPKKINLRDVVAALENNPFETVCKRLRKNKVRCSRSRRCKIKAIWQKINKNCEKTLKRVRISQLI